MRKTWEVIRFEVMRSLKKPSFWIMAIVIPAIFIGYILIVGLTSYNAGEDLSKATDTSELKLGYYDGADYMNYDHFKNSQDQEQTLSHFDSREQGIEAVQSGEIDVFYYIAPDFAESKKVEVHAKPEHLTLTTDYSATIEGLLRERATENLSDIDLAIISEEIDIQKFNYDQNNQVVTLADQIKRIAMPIVMFALLELIMMALSGRLANSMVEEKENRISELLLTSIRPINLITGKVISLMIIGLVQIAILSIPAIVLFILAKDKGIIPDEYMISLDPLSVLQYVALLVVAYFSITAAYVLVGTLSSTAKDCANYASFVAILMILPMLTMNVFTDTDLSLVERIMTYLPFTGPLSLAFRVIFNNLESWEYFVTLASSLATGILLIIIATRIFCKNSLDFALNLNFKKIFSGARTEWKK